MLVLVTLGLSALAADTPPLDLSVSPLVPTSVATFTATGATPGATVVFVGGAHTAPECAEGGGERCIRVGVRLGFAVADERGTAVLRKPLHERTPAGPLVFQAHEAGDERTSSAVRRAVVVAGEVERVAAVSR